MDQFLLQYGQSAELNRFPHIKEIAVKKTNMIQLNSLTASVSGTLRIYFVIDGKFEWVINRQQYIFYPGDVALIMPGQVMGGSKGFLDIGTLLWIYIQIESIGPDGKLVLGKWSRLSGNECLIIGKMLSSNNTSVLLKMKEAGKLLLGIREELFNQEVGFITRVNHSVDALLIHIARQYSRQSKSTRDFPKTFMKLEQTLRRNLAHQWTVEEMAALVELGVTAFTEKVKSHTGFSPLHYLINIRISEAIKLLKRADVKLTNIALDTGFCSSQHFSTTFKKLTGYTPGEFRRKNILKK